jgi:hypothetical protein
MQQIPLAILAMPEEAEIESTTEIRVSRIGKVIKQTIRCKNGIRMVLIKDVNENVFHVSLSSSRSPFWLSRNRLFFVTPVSPAGRP